MSKGETPLHEAAAFNANPAVVALLLDRGADLSARGGRPSVHDIMAGNDKAQETPLHKAAAFNANPAVVALLLDRGADLSARDGLGKTPLHKAAAFNANPAVVALLLDRGADATVRDDNGDLPVDVAEENAALRDTAVYRRLDGTRLSSGQP